MENVMNPSMGYYSSKKLSNARQKEICKTWASRLGGVLHIVWSFLPLVASAGMLGVMVLSIVHMVEYTFIGMIVLGWGVALTVSAEQLVSYPFECAEQFGKRFKGTGMLKHCASAIGFFGGLVTVATIPVVFTASKAFDA